MDRNISALASYNIIAKSLSARRAWIEMLKIGLMLVVSLVALRKESVDRNITRGQLPTPKPPSLSARRAWIEIFLSMGLDGRFKSLSARRAWIEISGLRLSIPAVDCRSPQGERG